MRTLGFLLLFGGLLGTPLSANGQWTPKVGVTLGLNVTRLDAPGDLDGRQMAAGGVVFRWGLIGPLSVQPQLLYSQKGATVTGTADDGSEASVRYGAGYVHLPLLLRVDGPSIEGVTPYVVAGGFGSVKVFEQQRAGGEVSFALPDSEISFFRRTNAGPTGGLGGTIPVGDGRRLNVVVRYEHGLVDVARSVPEQPYAPASFPSTGKTRTWAIMLRFGI